ncbi:hypothetical protein [Streptomyces sp. NPDC059080]|uniref:hypothetical protein n=1 Tax=Streptomyces sp. NPDC059080 TaxID=3346718 RepID=UPI00368BD28F
MLKVELSGPEVTALMGIAHGLSVEEISAKTSMRVKTVRGRLLPSAKDRLGHRDMSDAAAVERAYLTGALPAPPPDPPRSQAAVRLSPAQVSLIRLLSQGMTAGAISGRTTKSVLAVERDIRALCEVTGAATDAHLITRARQLGIPYRRRTSRPVHLSRRPVAL